MKQLTTALKKIDAATYNFVNRRWPKITAWWDKKFKPAKQEQAAPAEAKPEKPKPEKPMRAYIVEVNTGAGMRKIYVEAHDEKEAHYMALAQYMKEYFKTRVYPAPFKNTKQDEPKGTDKK